MWHSGANVQICFGLGGPYGIFGGFWLKVNGMWAERNSKIGHSSSLNVWLFVGEAIGGFQKSAVHPGKDVAQE